MPREASEIAILTLILLSVQYQQWNLLLALGVIKNVIRHSSAGPQRQEDTQWEHRMQSIATGWWQGFSGHGGGSRRVA